MAIKTKNPALIVGLTALLIAFSLATVKAQGLDEAVVQDTSQKKAKSYEERQKKHQEVREKVREKRCEHLEARITKRVSNFEKNKQKHIDRYNRLKTKLSNIITRLKNKGYDVAKLESDLKILDEKIKQYATDYNVFIDWLRESQDYACGQAKGVFKESVKKAREQLAVARESRKEVRRFYQEVIRQDIKDLRNQKSETE